jgi:hypothetical protein
MIKCQGDNVQGLVSGRPLNSFILTDKLGVFSVEAVIYEHFIGGDKLKFSALEKLYSYVKLPRETSFFA